MIVASVPYTAIEIERSSILTAVGERNEILTVTMPASHDFPDNFLSIVPGQIATLVIKRLHRTDAADEVKVIWYGRVQSVAFIENGNKASLAVKTIENSINNQIPRRTYQSLCNFVLFDTDCGIASSSFRFVGTVSVVSGNMMTIPGLTAAKGDEWSTGGYVALGSSEYRLILKQKNSVLGTDVVELLLPFPSNMVGKSVDVFAGCNHQIAVCGSKFSNVPQFGGCAWVPTKNIFMTGID